VTTEAVTERITIVRSELERLDNLCGGIVTRQGEMDACMKPATTVVFDNVYGGIWPACTWHAHRYGGALTLAEIRECLTTGATHIEREVEP